MTSGVLVSHDDRHGNVVTWSYMEPADFLAIDSTAQPSQYNCVLSASV